jgi:hypothetical protein
VSLAEFAGGDRLELAARAALLADIIRASYPRHPLLLGAGLVDDRGLSPAVIIAEDPKQFESGIYRLREISDAYGLIGRALGAEPEWLSDAVAFVIPSPELYVSAGDGISSPNIGTVGCQAAWTGGHGFLTAGHVAPTVNQTVFNGRTQLGTVRFASNPANGGTTIGADVAVVELASGQSFTGLGQAVAAGPKTSVTVKAAKSVSGTIMGFCSFIYWPRANGTYGDTYLTTGAVSTGGDSGSAVVDQNNDVVGMVIGGTAKVTTFIHDVRYQVAQAILSLPGLKI